MKILIATAEAQSNIQKINDATVLKTMQMEADATKYKMEMKAEGYAILFENPQYIQLEALKSAYHNSKIIIGDIPKNSIFGISSQTIYNPSGSTAPLYYSYSNNRSVAPEYPDTG